MEGLQRYVERWISLMGGEDIGAVEHFAVTEQLTCCFWTLNALSFGAELALLPIRLMRLLTSIMSRRIERL